jgi:erythromycin esterase
MEAGTRASLDGVARKTRPPRREGQAPGEVDLVVQEARSRIRFARRLSSPGRDSTAIRDEGMAEQPRLPARQGFPGRKVIVWAHNFHIAKEERIGPAEGDGQLGRANAAARENLHDRPFHGRAWPRTTTADLYAIASPPEASSEALARLRTWNTAFLDLERHAGRPEAWASQSMIASLVGINSETIVPNRTYDGVIYIDTVTPPRYR